MDNKKFDVKTIVIGLLIFAMYGVVFWGLIANVFETLYIVPILASGWAISMLIMFIKNWKSLWKSLNEETVMSDTNVTNYEQEPKDSFWVLHTIALIFFTCYYIGVIVIDLISR